MSSSKTPDSDPLEKTHILSNSSQLSLPIAPLPDPIGQNIEAIVSLQTSAERNLPGHHRAVEGVAAFFGRPASLYINLLVVALWMLFNVLPQSLGLPQFDPPPFNWLEVSLSISSLLMTIGVLIKQNRQENLAEQRAQLSLQLNLLSEQKIAKLIAMVEELRCDLPNVKNRYDPEVEVMKQAADPHIVVNALEKTLAEELAELQKQDQSG